MKKFYKGIFNYNSGMETVYRYANSKAQAKVLMMRDLANRHEVAFHVVFGKFDGSKANYLIEEEKNERKAAN